MKKTLAVMIAFCVLTAAAASAPVENQEVLYIGGTLPRIQPGTLGKFDTTVPDALVFTAGDLQAALPYKGITNIEYSRKLARRIGVIATIAVVAVAKRRQRKHFISITYKDDVGTQQVADFEVSKHQAPILMDILRGRAPRAFAQTLPPQRLLRR